jgi:endonuclease I
LLCLADAPSGYYKDAEGRTGNELKSALHKIIDGHKPLKYTISGNDDWHDGEKVDIWEALVYTDSACPEEEPKCGLVQMLYLDESHSISKGSILISASLMERWSTIVPVSKEEKLRNEQILGIQGNANEFIK